MTAFKSGKYMMCGASAMHAEASFSCAYSASNSSIIVIVDAILASIIICGLFGLVSALALAVSLLVLVRLLTCEKVNVPKMRKYA
jgi:hypothetical protein